MRPRSLNAHLVLFISCLLLACGSGGGGTGAASSSTSGAPSPTSGNLALSTTGVEVPPVLATPPFDQPHSLHIPSGFGIRVIARITGARFLAVTPDDGLLVSLPGSGKIILLSKTGDGSYQATDFLTALNTPHDMVFWRDDVKTWLYVSETHQVSRYAWNSGMTQAGAPQVVVTNLPNASSPGIGTYGHPLKNIAITPEGRLFVAIASTCNVCASDAEASPVRGSIYVYDADGRNGRLFARGLRNAEGLDIFPGRSQLWVAVNNRDNLPYPYHQDFDGDGKDDYGRIMPAFVDNNPPEPFTAVRDGGDYGWPYCNAGPRSDDKVQSIALERDPDTNADGTRRDCNTIDRASLSLPAHSAPLGMSFLQESALPAPWNQGAVIALHGCWNCTQLNGHALVFVPFSNGMPEKEREMVSGWVDNAQARTRWGRPVDAVPSPAGSLYISDDYSGTIYELYRK